MLDKRGIRWDVWFTRLVVFIVVSVLVQVQNWRIPTVWMIAVHVSVRTRRWHRRYSTPIHRVYGVIRRCWRHWCRRRRRASRSQRRRVSMPWTFLRWYLKRWRFRSSPGSRLFIVLNSRRTTGIYKSSSIAMVVTTRGRPIWVLGTAIRILGISLKLERSTEATTPRFSSASALNFRFWWGREISIVRARRRLWWRTAVVVVVDLVPRPSYRTRGSRGSRTWVRLFVVAIDRLLLFLLIIMWHEWSHSFGRKLSSLDPIQVVSRFCHVSAAVISWRHFSMIPW